MGPSRVARGGLGSTGHHFLPQGGQAEVAVAGAEHQQGGIQQADRQQHGAGHGEVSVSSSFTAVTSSWSAICHFYAHTTKILLRASCTLLLPYFSLLF